jgi:GAF domain-containing protein
MRKAEVKQSNPAHAGGPDIASYTNAVDEHLSRRTREATLRGEINRLLTRPDSTRRTLQACTDAIVNNLNVVFARIWTEIRVPYLTNATLGDPRIENQEWVRREGVVAFAGYPLVVDDRVVGVIAMFARLPIACKTRETVGLIAGIVA